MSRLRDKGRLSDHILQRMRDELDEQQRNFFQQPLDAPFARQTGFPFESERQPRSSRMQRHLDDLAARHPELARHFRPEMPFSDDEGATGGASSTTSEESTTPRQQNQTGEAHAKPPQHPAEGARKLPQYGLRNTVDLGGAAERLRQSEQRGQRCWSAPPDTRAEKPEGEEKHEVEEQQTPKRFVSRVEIQPQQPHQPPQQQNQGQPPQQPQTPQQQAKPPPPPRSSERVIPIFVEGRSEPLVPRNTSTPTPAEERSFGGRPSEDRAFGGRPADDRPFGARADERPFGSHSDERPFGARSEERPFGMRQGDERPFGGRMGDDRPFGMRRHFEPFRPQPQPPEQPAPKRPPQQPPPPPAPQPQPQKAPTPPPVVNNDPLARVAVVQRDIEQLTKEVEAFEGSSKADKQFVFLDEMLTRQLLRLDDIDTEGRDEVRGARRAAVASIQRAISLLEARVCSKTDQPQPQAAAD